MSGTKIVKIDPERPEHGLLKEAAKIIKAGGLVIIPTETVYGIAANMLNKKSLSRLYEIKNRPKDKPFSIHIAEKNEIESFACDIPVSAFKLIDKFWPGALTLILKSKDKATVGLRMPDNEIARRIIGLSGVPVVCPSANLSDKEPPVKFDEAIKDLNGLVELGFDAGPTTLQKESTIVDLTLEPPKIIREGAISAEAIQAELSKKTVLFICTGNSCRSVMAEGLLKKKMQEKNRNDVEVISAGVMMFGGLGATETTRELLAKEGIDASTHRSQRVTKDMLRRADIILVMERLHEQRILEIAPEVKNRLFLLKEFAKITERGIDIADPIARPVDFYENTFAVIKEAVERVSNII